MPSKFGVKNNRQKYDAFVFLRNNLVDSEILAIFFHNLCRLLETGFVLW